MRQAVTAASQDLAAKRKAELTAAAVALRDAIDKNP